MGLEAAQSAGRRRARHAAAHCRDQGGMHVPMSEMEVARRRAGLTAGVCMQGMCMQGMPTSRASTLIRARCLCWRATMAMCGALAAPPAATASRSGPWMAASPGSRTPPRSVRFACPCLPHPRRALSAGNTSLMAPEVGEGVDGPAYLPGLQVWGRISAGDWTLEKRALPPPDRQWVKPVPLAGMSLDRLCAARCSSQGALSGGCDDRPALWQLLCLARQAWC